MAENLFYKVVAFQILAHMVDMERVPVLASHSEEANVASHFLVQFLYQTYGVGL